MTAAELIDQGMRAYARGDHREAERCWTAVLEVDPDNAGARSYLASLAAEQAHSAASGSRSPPLPSAPAAPPWAATPPTASGSGPVPAPAWMRPPITLPPARAAAPVPRPAPAPAAPRREQTTTLSDYAPSPWDQGPSLTPAVVLGDGEGLDLASVEEKSEVRALVPEPVQRAGVTGPPPPRSDVEVWMEGARELFALGDFSGSLEMIERILKIDPAHAEARAYLRQNESTLIAMYESKIGSADGVPRLAIKPEEVMWLNLDHRAGFLLAQIDGLITYEDLFALSGLPRLDTARILASLLQEGVIRS